MASAAVIASSISSTGTRRSHYPSQASNASPNQTFPAGESANFTDSFALSSISINPLVTLIYLNPSLSQAVRTTDIRKQTISGPCTFIRLVHGENQQLLLNSYATCRRLLDHMKQVVGVHQDETIDIMDNEGKLKELNTHFDDYGTQFLTARSTYYVLKIEVDSTTNEKRYIPNFNLEQIDQKLSTILTNSLNTLNKSVSKPKRTTATSRQNTSAQSSSNTAHSKTKRAANRK